MSGLNWSAAVPAGCSMSSTGKHTEAALSMRTAAERTLPDGIGWMYVLGTWDGSHVLVALKPGGRAGAVP